MNNPNQLTPELAMQILQSLFAQHGQGFSLGQGNSGDETIAQQLSALHRERDPIGYANKMALLPADAPGSTNAFAPGGLFQQNRDRLSADPVLAATQGGTAANQLALLRRGDYATQLATAAKAMTALRRPRAASDIGTVTGRSGPATYLPSVAPLSPSEQVSHMINPRASNPWADNNWWQATGAPVNPTHANAGIYYSPKTHWGA